MVRTGVLFQAFNLSCTYFIHPLRVGNLCAFCFPRLRWRKLVMLFVAFWKKNCLIDCNEPGLCYKVLITQQFLPGK